MTDITDIPNRTAWEKLRLVKDLMESDEGKLLWNDISKTGGHIAKLLSWRPHGLEEHTDHDIEHSRRIIAHICTILPDEDHLNIHEIAILLFAALYHDVGMWTHKRDVEPALKDRTFIIDSRERFKRHNWMEIFVDFWFMG